MNLFTPQNSYFAAANGFSGFRSYFDEIFSPTEYERLYILKGGPGTGKSSLMKKTENYFLGKNYECDAIFCSSDPNSLDGIIIKNQSKKVAIIDGTAPHERDTKIPGAQDELVNLGAFWDNSELIKNRTQITRLTQIKQHHYQSAYQYLSLAGDFSKCIKMIITALYTSNDYSFVNDILFDLPNKNEGRNLSVRLMSSFGKDGYRCINSIQKASNNITVNGIYGSEYIFMEHLLKESLKRGADVIRYPSPYSDNITEAIYLKDTDTFICTADKFEDTVDTSLFVSDTGVASNKNELDYHTSQVSELLTKAKDEFKKASDAHFELESIYTAAMDFNKINSLSYELIKQIENQLQN